VRLVRVATINLPSVVEKYRAWEARVGRVTVDTLGFIERDGGATLLVAAELELDGLPDVNEQNQVVVPEDCRELESAIELTANCLAVAERARRIVSSADPPVALVAESDAEREWLDERDSFAFPTTMNMTTHVVPRCDALEMFDDLRDRPDGLALLAEALAHSHASGRFKEFIRLFERAFAAATQALIGPLSTFLVSGPYRYDQPEVEGWIIDVRHPLVHADRRPEFLVEADVRHLLPRVEQAAYDVVFNKEQWRSRSSGRRDLWRPDGINRPEGPVIRQGATPTLRFQLLDSLGVYPFNAAAHMTEPPAEWWSRFPEPTNTREVQ